MKYNFTLLTTLLLAPLAVLHAAEARRPAGKSNIIVILTDYQGYAGLSCQRQVPYIKTPNLSIPDDVPNPLCRILRAFRIYSS